MKNITSFLNLLQLFFSSHWKFSSQCFLTFLFFLASNNFLSAHSVQSAWCFSPSGQIRVYLEHWHGDFTSVPTGSTVDVTISANGGAPMTQTLAASGVINNTPIGGLPCIAGSSMTVVGGCVGEANTYNDWAYWDAALPVGFCPAGGIMTVIISNPNNQDFEDCGGLFPASVTSTVQCPCLAPIINCPADISIDNEPGICEATVTYTTPVGSDFCDNGLPTVVGTPAPTVQTEGLPSGSAFPVGTTTNEFVVYDSEGLSSSCNFDVTVNDIEAPTITCPSNIVVDNDANLCEATISYTVVASDNCQGAGNIIGDLQSVLDGFNANFGDINAVIANQYNFSDGVTGTNIGDGGGDMYDGGNYLNTNFATSIPYSDNTIVSNTGFGTTGAYFTRK